MTSTRYGSSSSNSVASDEDDLENDILLGEFKANSVASPETVDEGYASETPTQRRWAAHSGFQSVFMRTPRMRKLQRIIQSLIATPKVQNVIHWLDESPNWEPIKQSLVIFLLFLIPSFIYPWTSSKPRKFSSMAYLDGLRGVAALFVMIHHYTCLFTPALLEGWGSDPENSWILQLPLIRVVHSGSFMVVLFFVISGCVLSARGLKLARSRKKPEFTGSLASSVFRRWLRLHLPVIASMCVALFVSRMQWWTHLQPDWLVPPGAPKNLTVVEANLTIITPAPITNVSIVEAVSLLARSGNLAERSKFRLQWDWTGAKKNESLAFQLEDFVLGIIDVCDPFRGGGVPGLQSAGYNAGMILWTIPSEFLGSIVVFVVVLGIAWTRTWLKLSMLAFLVLWCHYTVRWSLATFLSGTFIAELTLIHEAHLFKLSQSQITLPTITDEKEAADPFKEMYELITPYKGQIATTGWVALFVVGCYIGALPMLNWGSSPGFVTLRALIPSWYFAKDLFYPCLGSIFIMLSITYCSLIQKFFTTSIAQYLGRVSFSLYLLHTQVLCSLGIRVMTRCMKFVGGGETQFGFLMGITLGSAIMMPITFWAADVFMRAVDEKSVAFARWVAGKALVLGE
jgi:peptidoglycan/LPS O-acetylase OafA/YrhL